MNTHLITEFIGYFGSALALLSFLMTSVFRLRIINAAGGMVCTVYALMIHAYPTALMNTCLVIINIYYLIRIRESRQDYGLVEGNAQEPLIRYFLNYYEKDIRKYFPGFQDPGEEHEPAYDIAYVICHNAKPAGLFLGKSQADGQLEVALDYSTPEYRDCSVGTYLYAQMGEKGIRKLIFHGTGGMHEGYLKKMGFQNKGECYVKELHKR